MVAVGLLDSATGRADAAFLTTSPPARAPLLRASAVKFRHCGKEAPSRPPLALYAFKAAYPATQVVFGRGQMQWQRHGIVRY
jgi:hypothetical protein